MLRCSRSHACTTSLQTADWVALCTIVSAGTAEEKLWFSCARNFHGGVARCLLRTADLPLELKVMQRIAVIAAAVVWAAVWAEHSELPAFGCRAVTS